MLSPTYKGLLGGILFTLVYLLLFPWSSDNYHLMEPIIAGFMFICAGTLIGVHNEKKV